MSEELMKDAIEMFRGGDLKGAIANVEEKLKAMLDTPQTAEELIEKFDHSINIGYLRKLISILPSIETIVDGDLERYIIKPSLNPQTNLF